MNVCFFHGLESDGPGRKGGHLASLGWDLFAPTIRYRDPQSVDAAWTEGLATPRDAIPTSAHGPHWTLTEWHPCARRWAESMSRHWLAAL